MLVFPRWKDYIGSMAQTHPIAFTKMNGLGNDFVVIDARRNQTVLTGDHVRVLAARDNSDTRGCDQILVLHPPRGDGHVFMQIFNSDGSEVEACGNGARAVAVFLAAQGSATCTLETLGGLLHARATHENAEIDMPLPKFTASDIPCSADQEDMGALTLHADLPPAFMVNIGNPHAVIFVETGTAGLAARYGFELENSQHLPAGANINFASHDGATVLRLDTWERGAGLTKACGTGACATAVAAVERGLMRAGPLTIRPPFNTHGNDVDVLDITYTPDELLSMRGPVTYEFDAETMLESAAG